MMRRFEHGMLLLPVALMLAIAGAVAYAATREGSMSAAAVDARYEYEAARYLAEAGVTLAVWQNSRRGCFSPVSFGQLEMAGGTISIDDNDIDDVDGDSELAFAINASFKGASYRIERKGSGAVPFYDIGRKTTVSRRASDGDTFIRQGLASGQHNQEHLEVSDAANNNAHALLQFSAWTIPKGSKLVQAHLQIWLESVAIANAQPTLSVHRVTRGWPDNTTWSSPWTTPGGDYAANPEARIDITATSNAWYTLPITALVDSWVNKAVSNHGMLLKTVGMTSAKFYSSDGVDYLKRPVLAATYYPACD